jgi:hypothetical protein
LTDITLLFTKDPLQHSEQDIDAIIAKLREQRHAFNSAVPKAKAAPKGAPAAKIDLGGLSLD